MLDGPIAKVRKRAKGERGHGAKDKCKSCGQALNFVAELENGKKVFYWCWNCDVSGRSR